MKPRPMNDTKNTQRLRCEIQAIKYNDRHLKIHSQVVPVVWPQPRRVAVAVPAKVLVKPSAGRVTGVTLDGIG